MLGICIARVSFDGTAIMDCWRVFFYDSLRRQFFDNVNARITAGFTKEWKDAKDHGMKVSDSQDAAPDAPMRAAHYTAVAAATPFDESAGAL